MAKKPVGKRGEKVITVGAKKDVRHVRAELRPDDYDRLKRASQANGLSMAAYVRMAILNRIADDEVRGRK
jgi:hypothetical protein